MEDKTSRFDYIRYDERAQFTQTLFKELCEEIEGRVDQLLESPRAKALALTKLEEFYMWCGKAIRDDQIKRGVESPLQEERANN